MRTLTDNQLLEAWVARRSDPAFAELVRRYVDLVYSAALRQVGDPPLAEDVVQAVFLVLERKAASLRHIATLAGWLYRTTRFAASRAIRAEARRRRHEQEATSMNPTAHFSEAEDSTWAQVAPLLDQAMAALAEADRNAVLLRFFQGKPMGVVGEHLRVSEDAAKKRVSRAVDKLRGFYIKRGLTLSAAMIAGAVSAHSVQAAPAGLAKSVTALAVAKGAAASGSVLTLVKGVLKIMAWKNTQTAVVSIGLLLAAGSGTLIVLNSLASQPAAHLTNFELFKKQISTPGMTYDVEFVEGDIQGEPAISVANRFGREAISQSQRHYQATLQSNAFLLLQKHETVAVDNGRKSVDLFVDSGQYATKGCVRRDSAFVRLVDLNLTHTNPTVQSVAEEVKRSESKTCCACLFGLPNFDVSTIKWDGNRFNAKTASGFGLDGEVSISPDSGLVTGATYYLHGANVEHGDVSYSYSINKDLTSLPDVIIKHVEQVPNPAYAALNSFNIRILKYNQSPGICDSDVFMSPVEKSIYVISNGIPTTNGRRK